MIPLDLEGGVAVAHYRSRFACDANRNLIVFPRQELKALFADRIISEEGIGCWHDKPLYVLQIAQDILPSENLDWVSLRVFMLQGKATLFRMLSYASQVGTWSAEHRFCGSCGEPTQSSSEHRMRFCAPCWLEFYPRIAPCMIVLVTRGDEILLARSHRYVAGMYSVLAGYAESGESIEDCVRREIMEETRLRVHRLKYVTSQSWPFPHSMMLGFHAEYLEGDIVPQWDEIEDARWFNVRDLPELPMQGSIARYLIDLYLSERLGLEPPAQPF